MCYIIENVICNMSPSILLGPFASCELARDIMEQIQSKRQILILVCNESVLLINDLHKMYCD